MAEFKIRKGSGGIHLFNRETGLNFLFDEFIPPTEIWSKAPRQVSIALTNLCDLHCSYCFAPKHKTSLKFNQLKKWITELDRNGCLGIGFGGGEPTLYSELSELCKFVKENTNLAVTLTTHAHRLSKELSDALKGNVHFIRVSMDGMYETYEQLRGKSFVSFCHQLELAKSIAPFGINYVVNNKTISDLHKATKFAYEVGASEFLLLPEQPTSENSGIDEKTSFQLRNWVYGYKGKIRLSVSEISSEGLPICNPLGSETELESYAHIDAEGKIKRTSYEKDGIMIGEEGILQAIQKLIKIL